jgi:hypothetical protein
MNKLNIPIIMILGLYLQSVMAQAPYDEKLISKYCVQDENAKAIVRAEVVEKNGKKTINCHDGNKSQLWLYEWTNITLNRSSDDKFDKAFFSSAEWDNHCKKIAVKMQAGARTTDPEKCEIIAEGSKYTFQCSTGINEDITLWYDQKKKELENDYHKGEEIYALSSDGLRLKDLNSSNALPTKDKSVEPETRGRFSASFWDDIDQYKGIQVKLDNIAPNPWLFEYNNQLEKNEIKYKPQGQSLYQPMTMVDEKLLTPVTFDKKFVLIPLNPSKEILKDDKDATVKEKIDLESTKGKDEEEVVVKDEKVSNCNDKLTDAIAKLLESDTKNIIGLQYELTVIKMAAEVVGAQRVSLEGLAKKYKEDLAKEDTGILAKMKKIYEHHGLKEDEKSVLNHLKVKVASGNYYARDKRFFNQDSSAFLIAYQQIKPEANINDTDVSVLWFMDKVSEKSKAQNGQYESLHNRTNLSTRIAQYTGSVDASKALPKETLNEMAKKQKNKIDTEFLTLLKSFKDGNPTCFTGEGDNDCKMLGEIEVKFSELLAINSKIPFKDVVLVENSLKGGINKTRFSITKYVESAKTKTVKETEVNRQPGVQTGIKQEDEAH